MTTSIEWTDVTWNPVTGCTKVSPGCKNCYAEGIADRFFTKQYPPNADGSPRKFTDVRCHPERLEEPLHWKKPRRVFVNSMSDLFHEDVPAEFIGHTFGVMWQAARHTFQILTKRPQRMLAIVSELTADHSRSRFAGPWPLPNVWLGVSVENQKQADERIPLLVDTPAAIRFLSVEPQLEAVSLFDWLGPYGPARSLQQPPQLDWVICGGESGPGARPFNLAWAESLLEQCRAAGVPFFMKQMGSRPQVHSCRDESCTHPDCGMEDIHLKDRKGGDMPEWPAHLRVREFPNSGATMAPCEPSSTAE